MNMKIRHNNVETKMNRTHAILYYSYLLYIIYGATLLISLAVSAITIGIPVIVSSITIPTGFPVLFN